MNGRTQAYLDLAAMPQVGALLLDARPAMIFRGDGSAVLWSNAAGVAFLGEPDLATLLARSFRRDAPLAVQLARLAKALPTDHDRLEILRFSFGVTQTALPAACRRLELGAGARAVLLVGTTAGPRESLSTRAERLADVVAGSDSLAAVLDADGRVLGASGGFEALEPASAALDALILEAGQAGRPVVRQSITIGSVSRNAGVARVGIGGENLYLLIVGPERPAAVTPVAPAAVATAIAPEPAAVSPAAAPAVEPAGDETPPPQTDPAEPAGEPIGVEPPVRFLWRSDAVGCLTFVSPELAGTVGEENAPLQDETWKAMAHRLDLDADGDLDEALSGLATFSAVRLFWPIGDGDEAVAVDFSGIPEFARDRTFRGYRGFGTIQREIRQPRVRRETVAEPPQPAAAAQSGPEAPAPPPPSAGAAVAGDDLDDIARELIEGTPSQDAHAPAPSPPVTEERRGADVAAAKSNVVHIAAPPTRILPRRLSGNEEEAFRRIAEALGAQIVEATNPDAVVSEAAPPAPAPAPDTSILDRLPVGVVIHRDDRTLYANRALLELLGHDDLAGFVAAGGASAVFPADHGPRTATNGEAGTLDALRRDGGRVAVEARLHAVPWAGATAMMLSLVRAPTEPPAMPAPIVDEASAGRVRELETILDTATDGVVIIEDNGTIAGINRAAEALFGIEADDVTGTAFTELLAEESRKAALDYIDGLSANGVASVLNDGREVIGKVPRGGLIPLFMTIGRLGESGKYCAVLRDITHWKNVEEELVAARRAAEAANAQKSEFLAKISHEIRTPLNAIIGFSEVMMEERFGPIGSERYRSYLRDIHLSGEHLMSLINDLLDLSKVEAGKLDLNFEAVSLNDVIRECVALMQPQANRERIIIRSSLSTSLPNVVADLRSLRQILLNLLSNAIKFTRSGGQVIVATALEESGEVVVRIRDTGVGMTADDIDTAMKPFRQVATSGRPGEGTGLGLPLTKALVEANRASFAIDSVPNQGTLVRVTFPTTRVLAG